MRITYIGFGDFHVYAGMKQLYHFAQQVCRQGHQAQILIAGSAETVQAMEEPPLAEIVEMAFVGPSLARPVRQRVLDFEPDILHVWTPRHVPALAGWQLQRCTGAKLILDHEDDEDYHLRSWRRLTANRWKTGVGRLASPLFRLRSGTWHWVRPLHADGRVVRMAKEPLTYHLVAQTAVAHTVISPNLVLWAQRQWLGVPVHLLYPGASLELFGPHVSAPELRQALGLQECRVVVYSGAMSLEIFDWFLAVMSQVVSDYPDTALVLLGDDHFRCEAQDLLREQDLCEQVRLVGRVPYAAVPRYLSLADVLLQHPLDQGNEFRLPAKLPEYLAMGHPVVTYAQGIGESLEENLHVRKLYTADPKEAAGVVSDLLSDPHQCEMLGKAAREVAGERFDWNRNGRHLLAIYEGVLAE